MNTSHKVRVWSIERLPGKKKTTCRVRWVVGASRFGESFSTAALADSFRARLLSAARNGEAFDTERGLSISLIRSEQTATWFDFACEYIDMKWPDSSPKYRKSLCESLTTITVAMLHEGKPLPDGKDLRRALKTAFNTKEREKDSSSAITQAVKTISRASRKVSELSNPDFLRAVLRALDLKLDGERASTNTVRHRRATLSNAIDFALEKKLLDTNPLDEIQIKKRNYTLRQVDPQSVINTMQGRMLLEAVGEISPPLVAFFGLMYYAALRPEEVTNLKRQNLSLPEKGWGDIHLDRARPEVGEEWTDSGKCPTKNAHSSTERTAPAERSLVHQH
jgi:integrase